MSFNLFRKFYRISIYNSRIINLSEIILVIPQPDLLSHSKVLSFVKFQNCDSCSLNSYPWCKVLIHIRTLLAVPMNLLRTLYGSQDILPIFPTTLSSLIFMKLMGCPHMISNENFKLLFRGDLSSPIPHFSLKITVADFNHYLSNIPIPIESVLSRRISILLYLDCDLIIRR